MECAKPEPDTKWSDFRASLSRLIRTERHADSVRAFIDARCPVDAGSAPDVNSAIGGVVCDLICEAVQFSRNSFVVDDAVLCNTEAAVVSLLARRVRLLPPLGAAALSGAARVRGLHRVVDSLVRAGASPDADSLVAAVQHESGLQMVQALLTARADPNAVRGRHHVLNNGSLLTNRDVLDALLDAGADPALAMGRDGPDGRYTFTADSLIYSVVSTHGDRQALRRLIAHGQPVDASSVYTDQSLLSLAANADIAEVLIVAGGADVNLWTHTYAELGLMLIRPADDCVDVGAVMCILAHGGRFGGFRNPVALERALVCHRHDDVETLVRAGARLCNLDRLVFACEWIPVLVTRGHDLWHYQELSYFLWREWRRSDSGDANERLANALIDAGVVVPSAAVIASFSRHAEVDPDLSGGAPRRGWAPLVRRCDEVRAALLAAPRMADVISHDCVDLVVAYLCTDPYAPPDAASAEQ
jgi:hypothetical protein